MRSLRTDPRLTDQSVGLSLASRLAARGLSDNAMLHHYVNLIAANLAASTPLYDWDFNVYVLTSRSVDSAYGQELLDKLVSGAGEDSIRQILFENADLGLDSTDAQCYALKGYGGSFDWAKVPHVGAVLKVTVRTDGRE